MFNFVPKAYAFDLGEAYGYGHIKSLGEGLGYLTGPIFMIAGLAVVIYFLLAGFKYLTSGGDKNATTSAKNMITHSIIGLVLLIVFFLFIEFLPKLLKLNGFELMR